VTLASVDPEQRDVVWSVLVRASAEVLTVQAAVELESDRGFIDVFSRQAKTADAEEAARLVAEFATAVCAVPRPSV